MTDSLAARFLDSVWKRQNPQPGQFTFISIKDWDTGDWQDMSVGPMPRKPLPTLAQGIYDPAQTDIYFCPNWFDRDRRQRIHATGGQWLYADLDEVRPDTIESVISPTLAWQTSSDRFQALWLLDRHLSNRTLELLNRRLTYYIGADKGGWSLTKVLRVPGTVSTKYEDPFTVSMVPTDKRVHAVSDLHALLKDVDASRAPLGLDRPKVADLPAYAPLLRRVRTRLPVRARQLLNTQSIIGSDDRSARLWELEQLCLDAGLTPVQTLALVRQSVWNKYKGQRRELDMLWKEIAKANANRANPSRRNAVLSKRNNKRTGKAIQQTRKRARGLLPNTLSIEEFMDRQWAPPAWLVKDVWQDGAYGYCAGEYKSYKTVLLIDLMLSVASGTPFLDKYPVLETGPVCYIHEEGRRGSIREHLWRSRIHKGLAGSTAVGVAGTHSGNDTGTGKQGTGTVIEFRPVMPCHITSMARIDLTDSETQERLSRHVETVRPKLVILETFYLMSGDTNESVEQEVRPVLSFLKDLSERYGCAVCISHHFHKSKDDTRHANRVSGSGVWNKWYESSITAQRIGEDEENTVELRFAHRDGQATRQIVRFDWDEDTNDTGTGMTIQHLEERPEGAPEVKVTDAMVEWLTTQGKPVHMQRIANHFGITVQAARRRANRAGLSIENGKVSVG